MIAGIQKCKKTPPEIASKEEIQKGQNKLKKKNLNDKNYWKLENALKQVIRKPPKGSENTNPEYIQNQTREPET